MDKARVVAGYKLLERLGEGGMGVVYLAEGPAGGRVALKTLRAPDARHLHALRQEIRALRRLRHPGVVRVLDDGVEGGLPWVAMEFVEGRSLGAILSGTRGADGGLNTSQTRNLPDLETIDAVAAPKEVSSPLVEASGPGSAAPSEAVDVLSTSSVGAPVKTLSGPWAQGSPSRTILMGESQPRIPVVPKPSMSADQPLDARKRELLGWVGQVCRALAFMHGEGVVHCDLKPDNIVVTGEGRAVLLDFGLAAQIGTRLDSDEVERAGLLSGTALYLCPERIQGSQFDARADLYAIGCILYEILTGRPPFEGETVTHTYMRHLTQDPLSIGALAPGVPPRLEALVMALLAKLPQGRPGHAHVVVDVLEDLGVETGAALAQPPTRPYLYRASLQGREELLERLKVAQREASRGRGRAVMIGGESGSGKTALAIEVVRRARGRNVEVLSGQCSAGEGRRSLEAMLGPLRKVADRCRQQGAQGGGAPQEAQAVATREVFGDRLGVLAPYAPFLADLGGGGELELLEELPADAARLRLFRALEQTLEAFAGGRPLMLLVDDLQWADALSLACLRYLCGPRLRERPWFILGTCRDEGAEAVAGLLSQERVEAMRVERLPRAVIGEIMAQTLGLEEVPARFVEMVDDRAAGNPFFVAETMQMAVERGMLVMTASGNWRWREPQEGAQGSSARLSLPASLQSVLAHRLQSIEGDARRACAAAAVLGGQGEAALLFEVAGLAEEAFFEALLILERQRIIQDARAAVIRIAHDKLREEAYERLEAVERSALHRRAAAALDGRLGRGQAVELGRLGWHWEQCGELQKARVTLLAAAQEAVDRLALDEAERHFIKVLALLEAEPGNALLDLMVVATRIKLTEQVLMQLDRHEDAEGQLGLAVEGARRAGSRRELAAALSLLGDVRNRQGKIKEAIEPLEEALLLHEHLKDPRSKGNTLKNLANVTLNQGLIIEARATYEEALGLFEQVDDRFGQANALHNLGLTDQRLERHDAAMAFYEASLALYRALGKKRGESIALNSMAMVLRKQRRTDEALARHREGLLIHRAMGNRLTEAMTLNNMAVVYRDIGDFDEAMLLYAQALEIRREVGDARREVMTLNNMGNLHLDQGDLGAALSLYTRALEVARADDAQGAEAVVLASIAFIRRVSGDLEGALAMTDEALALCARLDDQGRQAAAHVERGRILLEMRDLDAASGALERGLDMARAQGAVALEAHAQVLLCRRGRLEGALRPALESLALAQASFEAHADNQGLAVCLCEQGHLALALRQDARPYLQRAAALAQTLGGLARAEVDADVQALAALTREIP